MVCFHCNANAVPSMNDMNNPNLFCGGEAVCVCDPEPVTHDHDRFTDDGNPHHPDADDEPTITDEEYADGLFARPMPEWAYWN